MAKAGRKRNRYFVTPDGQELVGFVECPDGRFRPSGRSSPKWSGPWQLAYHRFQVWKAQQTDNGELEPLHNPIIAAGDAESERLRIRDLIATDPKQAAVYLDYPPLARLANVRDLEPSDSLTVAALGRAYLDATQGQLTAKEWANSKTWWDEFTSITGAKTVADLDRPAFCRYRDTIKAEQKKPKRSNVWTRSRYGKIKTMINYAVNESELQISAADLRCLENRSVLKQPKKPKPRPIDIHPDHIQAILKVADKWDTAAILLGLNAAYGPVDCQRLTWDMVDFKNNLIRFDREKSEHLTDEDLPRICALWDRTIRALEAIKNGHSHVFVSVQGQPAHVDTINDHFTTCRDKAKIKAGFTFKHLRKSALTAASNSDDPVVPDRQVNLLAGHSAGIKEHYVVRKNVTLACKAIERYYFPKKKRGKK
ncbi:MAG: tyrosine-type recombinase/integrase [Phycisphaerae bacterium]|nr:tyrosine-type recombinase/integrase [Phycisphaerae bacterium]